MPGFILFQLEISCHAKLSGSVFRVLEIVCSNGFSSLAILSLWLLSSDFIASI